MSEDARPDIEAVFDYYNRRIIPSSGQWQKAECPLLAHEDRNPSASVNIDAGKWQCWSCDARGDVYDILKENEGLAGYPESKQFAEANFESGNGVVRQERVRGGGLSVRPGNHRGHGAFVPPWKGI